MAKRAPHARPPQKAHNDVRLAARLYAGFRERKPTRAKAVRIKLPKAVMVMGHAEVIAYVTTHGKRAYPYVHVFTKGCRPKLCAGTRKGELYLIGNRYRVTHRGIVDLSPTGRQLGDSSFARKVQRALEKVYREEDKL